MVLSPFRLQKCTSDASLKSGGMDLLSQMMVKSLTSRLVRFIPPCLYISGVSASEPAAFPLVSFFHLDVLLVDG